MKTEKWAVVGMGDMSHIVNSNDEVVAIVPWREGQDMAEHQATAALIEAAPKMLEACEHALEVLRNMGHRGYYPAECLPDEPEYMGKQGLMFLIDAIKAAKGV